MAVRGECDANDAVCVLLYCCVIFRFRVGWRSDIKSSIDLCIPEICRDWVLFIGILQGGVIILVVASIC